MTKIILVRHGQTDWNLLGRFQGHSDTELSAVGLQQAKSLAANFPLDKISAVYSSDLKRAYTTASCIAAAFDLDVVAKNGLREMDFGDWEGLTFNEIRGKWPQTANRFFLSPDQIEIPAGESFAELQQRSMAAIIEIVKNHPEQNVVVATHGAIIRTILAEALHMPLQYLWSIRQDNTAVNIIRYDEAARTVELVNSTAHLNT